MKKYVFLICILGCSSLNSYPQSKVDTLTNESIISLSKIGLQPSVIINKIHSSYAQFDVSTDALINLNKNGVDSQVINEMMNVDNTILAEIEMEQNATNPEAMHNAGIYIYDPDDADSPLTRLESISATTKTSSGGYGGFGGSSSYAILNGVSANYKIDNSLPVFYMYFPTNKSYSKWMFDDSSPKDFELAKLKKERNQRTVKTGGGGSFGYGSSHSWAIPNDFKILFTFDKVDEGIYKITFSSALAIGEYCFVYRNDANRVFDFSIIANK